MHKYIDFKKRWDETQSDGHHHGHLRYRQTKPRKWGENPHIREVAEIAIKGMREHVDELGLSG